MANFSKVQIGGSAVSGGGGPTGYGGVQPRSGPPRSNDGPAVNEDAGKFTIDLTKGDLGITDALGSAAEFAGGLVGGAAGVIGSIGTPEANLGDIPEAIGGALGGIGQIGIPGASYATNDMLGGTIGGGGKVDLGSVPGALIDLLGLPGRAVERTTAGQRVQAARDGGASVAGLAAQNTLSLLGLGLFTDRSSTGADLPQDLRERLDAGASVDEIADELVRRGAGFTNNAIGNTAAAIIFDPTNLLSGGVGAVGRTAQKAGIAVRLGDTGGARVLGQAYNAATHGLTSAQQAVVQKFVGPTTSGVFHTLGTKSFRAISGGLGKLAPEYAAKFEDYLGLGAAQLPRVVLAKQMGDEAASAARRGIALADEGEIPDIIEARLAARRTLDPAEVERDTEELLLRVAPDFVGHTPEQLLDETARKLALTADMSVEDALRVLGSKVDERTARTVHLAYYGRAGDDLVAAKQAVGTADNIDVERLTLIAPDTLTTERAAELLALEGDGLREAVSKYGILANRFDGTAFDSDKVRAFIERMQKEGGLPQAVRTPKGGANALPNDLSRWRERHSAFGYDLGFAPKDGWKAIIDEDTGDVLQAEPFLHFVSANEGVTMRNALGRFMDSLFRGASQTTIVLDSRARFVKFTRDLGISPNQAKAIHKVVLNAAADEGLAPRGLALFGSRRFDEAYEAVLGKEAFAELTQKVNPTYLLMRAFEGNLSRVGLTQKLSGVVKSQASRLQPGRGNLVAAITEGIYPKVRFEHNPLFQTQERGESPFWNVVRGVQKENVPEDIAKLYGEMSSLPEFRYLTEAGYFLHLAGNGSVSRALSRRGRLGQALSRFTDVKGAKERARVAQVLSEHPDEFRDAINGINPKLWRAMTEAYGTDDARAVADAFMRERLALASENIDEAMAVVDAAKPALEDIDGETVWQAFRESFRQASLQAFKTHYFNPRRGWVERTINHPYLGIYPASYMWGKVIPEFVRFMLKRPFGINAPLAGLNAVHRVQQQLIVSMADPEFSTFIEEHPDAIYLAEMLLPGTPTNLPANAPAWARHISTDLRAGRDVTADTLMREVDDTAKFALGRPISGATTLLKGTLDTGALVGDLIGNLNKAAAEYDGMFPAR